MKEKLKLLIFVLILGAISAGILTTVNFHTKPFIERNFEIKRMSSVLSALGIDLTGTDVIDHFRENISVHSVAGVTYFVTQEEFVAFEFYGNGLWGPISGIVALKDDLETIKGISIIHQEETPGLGGEIANKTYLEKFQDKRIDPRIEIVPPGTGISNDNQIDALTGATLTSKAFEGIINEGAERFWNVYEK